MPFHTILYINFPLGMWEKSNVITLKKSVLKEVCLYTLIKSVVFAPALFQHTLIHFG